ncbi:MAG: serine/threonine-protein kinase, partial [Myxococcota bacterium]
ARRRAARLVRRLSDEMPTDALLDSGEVRARFGQAASPGAAVERERVFSALTAKMFGAEAKVQIGRFVVDRKIGAGAMGVVYAAHDPELDRPVALKLLQSAEDDPSAAGRVEREARSLAKLRHPNVVAVHEVGTHDGDRFIAMDLVEGETLGAWLSRHRSWREILEIMVGAGRGLAAAHAADLVHRDFKPDNVLVEDGQARVVDFGLARPQLDPGDSTVTMRDSLEFAASLDSGALTKTGTVVGTPAYMAPEAFGGEADALSDQFSFCVTLFEALYGVRPFSAETIPLLRMAIEDRALARTRNERGVPGWVRRVVLRGLSYDPQHRWKTMSVLLSRLERHRGRSRARVVAAAAVGGTLVGAVVVAASDVDASGCARSSERMDAAWSLDRKATIVAGFVDTGLPYAQDTANRTIAAVDRYAKEWSSLRRATCEARFTRSEISQPLFDAKMQCLDRRLDQLDALAGALSAPDAQVVRRAVAASARLGALATCDNETQLQKLASRAAAAFPEAPASLYARLAELAITYQTGKYAETAEAARTLAAAGRAGGYAELEARAHLFVSKAEDRLAHEAVAEVSAKKAMLLAERLGDDELRARGQIALVSLLAQRHALEEGTVWSQLSRATLQRLGDPPRLQVALLTHEARLFSEAGRYDDALDRRREAHAVQRTYLPSDHPSVGNSREAIGDALSNLGRSDEALVELEAALEVRIDGLGETHPDVARTHARIAAALQGLGRLDESMAASLRSIELTERALGPEHPDVAEAHAQLAIALAQGEDSASSIPHFQKAIAILEAANGPESVSVGFQLGNLGRVLAHEPRAGEAVGVLQRALAIITKGLGENHPDTLYPLNSLCVALIREERYDEALAHAQRAVRVGTRSFENDHPTVASALLQLGTVQRLRGDLPEAIASLTSALEMQVRLAERPAAPAEARLELARVHIALGEQAAAEAQVRAARDALEQDPGLHSVWLEKIELWLETPSLPL